jgi:hypothetical protein
MYPAAATGLNKEAAKMTVRTVTASNLADCIIQPNP